jgi:hypothetical protein
MLRCRPRRSTCSALKKISAWTESHVKTRKVKKAMADLAAVPSGSNKAELLRVMATEYGYKGPCPMADELASIQSK